MAGRSDVWLSNRRRGRRPVSRWRHRIGIALLTAIILGVAGYRHLTAEDRLRHFAERWLESFSGGETHVDAVEFDLFSGLNLVGVRIATPASAGFHPPGASLDERTIFTAGTLFLRLQPLSIVSGNLIVPEIVAINPRLTLVSRMPDGKKNWELLLHERRPQSSRGGRGRLPLIRLRNVEVQQFRLNDRGRTGGGVQVFFADAQPLTDQPQVYDLMLTKIIPDAASQELRGEAGRLEIDMTARTVHGSLPSLSMQELLFAAPPEVNRWLDILNLRGYVRAETFSFDPRSGGQARLSLRDARLSIPVDERETQNPHEVRYVQFASMAGTILFDGERAEVQLEGRFRESPIRLSGRMLLPPEVGDGLAGVGFELQLDASNVPLPRNDERVTESERRFVQRWHKLQAFVEDFDGIGPADLSLTLLKGRGTDKGIQFVEGRLVPLGVSAAYHKFPYRIHNMTGEVLFRQDGRIDLVDLAGSHGDGRIVINGQLDGSSSRDAVRLSITGEDIALDEELLRCLAEDDRALCRRFVSDARMNLKVQLNRTAAAPDEKPGPWTTTVDAEFLDGTVRYEAFPYPLDSLTGHMHIASGRLELTDLRATHGDTVVRLSGSATRSTDAPKQVDLQLAAADIPLDDLLLNALPADVQPFYRRFGPDGRANVSGRVFTPAEGGPISFDLIADLNNATMTLPGSAVRLSAVTARLRLRPDQLEVESLTGRFDEATVSVNGRIALATDKSGLSLRVQSGHLHLGEHLRAVLPESLQEIYDRLSPSGHIALDLRLDRTGPDNLTYEAAVEARDCDFTYEGFPLPLTKVNGRLTVTPGAVSIDGLTAEHEEARLQFSGRVTTGDGGTRAELSIQAHNLALSEPLRQSVPWRMRRMWNNVKPRGRCDLRLDPFVLVTRQDGSSEWDFTGSIDLKEAGLSMGPELTEVDGRIEGSGGYADQFHMDGKASFAKIRVDDRLVTGLTAKMQRRPGDPVFRITDLLGGFYEGKIIGAAELDYSPGGPRYGLTLTARDVSLQEFLNAKRAPDEPPVKLQGRVEGMLALAGRFDDPASRHGSGNVLIQDAQMLKVPLILAILQVIHFAIDDDNAFHDAVLDFIVDGSDLILERIDLRGKALSMVGAGRVHIPQTGLELVLLVGSPLRLPRVEVLTELMEGVARELMEVHVEGTLDQPTFRAELVRSVKKTLEAILNVRRASSPTAEWSAAGHPAAQ